MKIRTNFVSNSSTSSFVCNVCNEIESDSDLSFRDTTFLRCENGHTFCPSHKIGKREDKESVSNDIIRIRHWITQYSLEEYEVKKLQAMSDKELREWWDEDDLSDELKYEFSGQVFEAECPICTLNALESKDLLSYILKRDKTTKEELTKEISSKFVNFKELSKFLSE